VGGFFVSFQQVHGVLVFMADVRTLPRVDVWLIRAQQYTKHPSFQRNKVIVVTNADL
jgi:hypothetical protein